jgi:tetratricopeptide (TPR) repeat protein
MIEAFFKFETEENGNTDDLFLKFSSSFTDSYSYNQSLCEELAAQIDHDQEFLREEGIVLNWRKADDEAHVDSPVAFFNNIASFADSIQDLLGEGYIVAYLSPQDKNNLSHLETWLINAVKQGIPQKVRVMVMDTEEHAVFDRLSESYPEEVNTLRPELNMDSALQLIAARGNPLHPDVQFRKAFVGLTQAVAKGNLNALNSASRRAMNIARLNKWPHLEVATLMAVASTYLGKRQYDQAMALYRQAEQVINRSYPSTDKLGANLATKIAFAQGSTLIAAKDFNKAARLFENTVATAERSGDRFFQMEAWRLAGYCHEQDKNLEKAWNCHNQALSTAEKLDVSMQKGSTVPFIGQALLRLVPRFGKRDDELPIRQKLQRLVGTNWESKLIAKVKR